MDHEQKALSMKYQEDQVEYFGKKGMSLPGFIVMSHYLGNTDAVNNIGRFQYELIDIVLEFYSGQDNVQVASFICHIMNEIKKIHPKIGLVALKHDNAS
eukprot:12023659-Ditylum_brightwellii.AAC.1